MTLSQVVFGRKWRFDRKAPGGWTNQQGLKAIAEAILVQATARHNDGSAVTSVNLAGMDGIVLRTP